MTLVDVSLWRDEAFAALLVRRDPIQIIQLSAGDATPPLFYVLLHYWVAAFGESEVALRSLSFLFFLATAVVMFALGSQLGGAARWWLPALSLTQPFLFRYAFEARAYSLLALLTAAAILFYMRRNRVPLAVVGIALAYTHVFGLLVLGVLLGWAVLTRGPVLSLLIALVANLPWIPNYFQFAREASQWWLKAPTADVFALDLTRLGAPLLLLLLPVLRSVVRHEQFKLSALLWLAPIIGALVLSVVKPVFLDRYLIVIVPAQLLMLGLPAAARHYRVVAALVLVAQIAGSAYIFTHSQKPPFRELATYLESQRQPGDVVLNRSANTYFESQYYGLGGKILTPDGNVPIHEGRVLIASDDIVTTPPVVGERYFWIELRGSPDDRQPLPLPLIERKDFGTLTLSLYRAR
jgi:hypothetical protein